MWLCLPCNDDANYIGNATHYINFFRDFQSGYPHFSQSMSSSLIPGGQHSHDTSVCTQLQLQYLCYKLSSVRASVELNPNLIRVCAAMFFMLKSTLQGSRQSELSMQAP